MAAPPGHPFLVHAMARLEPAFKTMSKFQLPTSGTALVLGSTGPNFLTRALREYAGKDVLMLPMARVYGVQARRSMARTAAEARLELLTRFYAPCSVCLPSHSGHQAASTRATPTTWMAVRSGCPRR